MSAGAETTAGAGAAAVPGLLSAIVLAAGPPAGAGVVIWAALIGGSLGGYGGGTFQLLRDLEGPPARRPSSADWLRLGLRVSASASFGVLASLTLAAMAGHVEAVPHILAHPFVVAGISGGLAFVAPIAVPRLQRKVGKAIDNYQLPGGGP